MHTIGSTPPPPYYPESPSNGGNSPQSQTPPPPYENTVQVRKYRYEPYSQTGFYNYFSSLLASSVSRNS